ncbi:MAG: DNA-3-methyladenine glycosylase I, partial [Bacteroidota bacterium]
MQTYCEKARNLDEHHVDRIHHDHVHGFAVRDDNELFGRLILEINQAGLSWNLMLKKQDNFRRAFDGFDIAKVARYGETDRQRLLNDAGIIRNRRKIDAVIHNACVIRSLQVEFGSFKVWLDASHPRTLESWVKLFKHT